MVKNPSDNAGDTRDTSSIPGLGRFSGGGNDNPSSILVWRILMDREAYSPWGLDCSD